MAQKGYHLLLIEMCFTQKKMVAMAKVRTLRLQPHEASKHLWDATGCCPRTSTFCKKSGHSMLDGLRGVVFLAAAQSALKMIMAGLFNPLGFHLEVKVACHQVTDGFKLLLG